MSAKRLQYPQRRNRYSSICQLIYVCICNVYLYSWMVDIALKEHTLCPPSPFYSCWEIFCRYTPKIGYFLTIPFPSLNKVSLKSDVNVVDLYQKRHFTAFGGGWGRTANTALPSLSNISMHFPNVLLYFQKFSNNSQAIGLHTAGLFEIYLLLIPGH